MKSIQVGNNIKNSLEYLKDLYGFKSMNETITFITICHEQITADNIKAVDFMTFSKMAKEYENQGALKI